MSNIFWLESWSKSRADGAVICLPIKTLSVRSYLKKVFWPNLGVGRLYQILEIRDVFTTQGIGFAGTSGLIFASALTLNQNPFFEIASIMSDYCFCPNPVWGWFINPAAVVSRESYSYAQIEKKRGPDQEKARQ